MTMVPTGFRFNPTDEELIEILEQKVSGQQMAPHFNFIVERNVYDYDPQHLQWDYTAAVPDNERYCYCMKENDSREVTGRGWWKATSHVKKIYSKNGSRFIGYRRPLTFHRFKDNQRNRSNAIKTNWIMHEFSLQSPTTEWRLCKIKYKGKPSLQEELENARNGFKLRNDFEASSYSSSSAIMGLQQQAAQTVELEQPKRASYDPFFAQITSTNNSSELENTRNGFKITNDFEISRSSSTTIMGMGMGMQQQQTQALEHEQQQLIKDSYDPFLTQFLSTNDYYDFDNQSHQLGQAADSSLQISFPSNWSWQN
ncbi:putative NAC domain-containing protein [Melia azedarach]|uniref:NAC domain-containing protein n=1 Tax=Melia azedarach TaxID=155640 RepID=A0ACC1YIS6_MELAZ|nr:putative NAC domain-containing protein [Melia azedarach]